MLLPQSTAVVISFGPFVDKTDGVTPETGLVSALDHASTGIKLSKAGGALTIRHASVTASTYDGYGNYLVTLDTTDTDTLGRIRVQFIETATCLPVWQDFEVVPAAVYNSLIAGSAVLTADVTKWNGTAIATPDTAGYPKVTVKSGTGTGEISLTSGVAAVNTTQIAGSAVSTSTAQLGVNVVNFGGSAGTFSSGRPETNATHWGGTAVASATVNANATQISGDSTAADNAELFFDGTGYNAANSTVGTATTIGSTGLTAIASAVWSYAKATAAALATTTMGRYVYDKLGYITSTTAVTTSTLVSNGSVLTIFQGEGRTTAGANQITLEVAAASPDLTGYTARFGITKVTSNSGTSTLEITGTISGQVMTFEITKAQTAALALSTGGTHAFRINPASYYAYRYTISAFKSTTECPVFAQGYVDVKVKDTTCS